MTYRVIPPVVNLYSTTSDIVMLHLISSAAA